MDNPYCSCKRRGGPLDRLQRLSDQLWDGEGGEPRRHALACRCSGKTKSVKIPSPGILHVRHPELKLNIPSLQP